VPLPGIVKNVESKDNLIKRIHLNKMGFLKGNWTIVEKVKSILLESELLKNLWTKIINIINYVVNQSPL
jgi:hypothetical protein